MKILLYGAMGVLFLIITLLYTYIRGNAFIIPSSNPTNLTITLAPTLTQQQLSPITSTPKNTGWICPANGWINCMPIVEDTRKYQCEDEYINWAKSTCENFQGVSY